MPSKIKKRGENSYLLTVAAGYDGKGKQITFTKTIHSKNEREAKKQYTLFVAEVENGQVSTSGTMTLSQFYDYWKENYALKNHQPTTIAYNDSIFKRIGEALGHKRLNQIEPQHLLAFYKNLAEPGVKKVQIKKNSISDKNNISLPKLSSNTIKKHHSLLFSLLNKAVQWNLIPYNPAARVDAPKVEKKPKTIYNVEQISDFLQILETQPVDKKLMVMFALSCGMRREEIFGLQWKHINMKERTINIEQACVYTKKTGVIIKSTKNHSSNRLITYPPFIDTLIKQHKAKQSAKRLKLNDKWEGLEKITNNSTAKSSWDISNDFVFTQWNGKITFPSSFGSWLRKLVIKNGLPPISPHIFRHIAATLLITAGTDIRTVSGKLGHAQTSTTMNIYSHLLKKAEAQTADTMNTFLEKTTENTKQKKQAI